MLNNLSLREVKISPTKFPKEEKTAKKIYLISHKHKFFEREISSHLKRGGGRRPEGILLTIPFHFAIFIKMSWEGMKQSVDKRVAAIFNRLPARPAGGLQSYLLRNDSLFQLLLIILISYKHFENALETDVLKNND